MSISEELAIFLKLLGKQQAVVGLQETTAATEELGAATAMTGREMETTRRRSFLMNQALFTTRRFVYMGSLAFVGLGIAALDLGFKLDSTMQQARVAMQSFIKGGPQAVNRELINLYKFAAYTPFQFRDILQATRTMLGFQVPLNMTNRTIRNLVDVLSARGGTALTAAGLNRVTVALGHMMNTGRITGQILLQLARDGVPLYKALQQQLGLTADQVHHIGQLGIPATTVMNAINRYIEGSAFHGAAYRQATETLKGLFTTFKDFFALVAGRAEFPLFKGFTTAIRSVNKAMADSITLTDAGKATVTNLSVALDKGLGTPLRLITHLWEFLSSNLRLFGAVAKPILGATILALAMIFQILGPIAHLVSVIFIPLFNQLHFLEPLLAILIARTIIIGITMEAARIAAFLWSKVLLQLLGVESLLQLKQMLLNYAQLIWYLLMIRTKIATVALVIVNYALALVQARLIILALALIARYEAMVVWLSATRIAMIAVRIATLAWTAAQWLLNIALDANPIGIVIIAVALLATGIYLLITHLDWVKKNWMLLVAIMLGPFGVAAYMTIKHFSTIVGWIKEMVGWLKEAVRWMNRLHPTHIFHSALHGVGGILSHIPGLQAGGTSTLGGWSMVGEQGPELAYLPTGASVIPLSAAGQIGTQLAGREQIIRVPIFLDGRQIAEVVARHNNDWLARR